MEKVIDARLLEPSVKHPRIISQVQNLTAGDHLILVNDHDPLPLYYQLIKIIGNTIKWEYIESGENQVWKVKIKKNLQYHKTVGEMAVEYPAAIQVFQKYDIDFCCNGKRYFEEVCREKGLEVKKILKEIKESQPSKNLHLRFDNWTSSSLCDFIVNNHHSYVRQKAPQIMQLLDKITKVHGDTHPALEKVNILFAELKIELDDHMYKEENEYFPAVKNLEIHGGNEDLSILEELLMDEHQQAGNLLIQIRKLCDNYAPPMDACASFEMTYEMLQEFEEDLHQHIHLENNVLFPRVEKPIKMKSCPVKN